MLISPHNRSCMHAIHFTWICFPEKPTVSTTPGIPYADQARINVNIKLTSEVYTSDLEDQTSKAYKSLRTKVEQTVININ